MQQTLVSRDWQPDDIPAIASLMVELGYPTTEAEMTERMNQFASNPDYKTIVLTHNDEIVGVIGMARAFFWEQNGCYVRIQALVVKSTARRMGAGEQLIRCAEEWALSVGAKLLQLNCGNKEIRAAAHQFYPSVGFTHTSSGYVKEIDM